MIKKKTIIFAVVLFVLTCLIPPWQYTADQNGSDGFHARKPAGYAPISSPPDPERDPYHPNSHGVQMDFSILLVEWVMIGAATGLIIFFGQGKRSS